MDYGVLSSYFDGAVAKKLVAVDIDRKRSNQHEFNGTESSVPCLATMI